MKKLLLLLLIAVTSSAQINSGVSIKGSISISPATSGTLPSEIDFQNRSNGAGVLSSDSLSGVGTVGAWSAFPVGSSGVPTSIGWPIQLSLFTDGVTTGVPDSSIYSVFRGSTRLSQTNTSGSGANGGQLMMEPVPTTTSSFYPGSASGIEFYYQIRQRIDPNFLLFHSGNNSDGYKDVLASAADRFINSQNYMFVGDCSDFQFVFGDNKDYSHFPIAYYGCQSNGTQDGGQQNLFPSRTGGTVSLYENAIGCLRSNTSTNQQNTPTAFSRAGNVVTMTLQSNPGSHWVVGAWMHVSHGTWTWPDITIASNVLFDGTFQLTGVGVASGLAANQVTFAQVGPDQTLNGAGVPLAEIYDYSHCFQYQANEWMTYLVHFKLGSDYKNNSHNYRRDTLLELYAAHEGSPYQLLISIPDIDLVMHDQGNTASSPNKFNNIPEATPSNWWNDTGTLPGFFRLKSLIYESYRCIYAANIKTVSRSAGGIVTVSYNIVDPTGGQSSGWNGGSPSIASCAAIGDTVTLAGAGAGSIAGVDAGSFIGTFTVCGPPTTGCALPNSGSLTFEQAGNTVASTNITSGTSSIADPKWFYNCGGGPCNINRWVTEYIPSTKFIPNPKVCLGATACGGQNQVVTVAVPDPATDLQVTAVNTTTGATTMTWIDNDPSLSTTYKVMACTGDKYLCDVNQASGTGWASATLVGTVASCASQYCTNTFTYSPGNNTTQYSFIVIVHNASGDSTRSNAAMNTPGIPSDLVATYVSPGNQTLSWVQQPPSSQTSFKVQRCQGIAVTGTCSLSGAGWADVPSCAVVSASLSSCTDTDALTNGNSYVYRIEALYGVLNTHTWGGANGSGETQWGGNNGSSQILPSSSSFLGIPITIGWNALGSATYSSSDPTCGATTSSNCQPYTDTALAFSPHDNTSPVIAPSQGGGTGSQCLPNNWNGTLYVWSSTGNGNGCGQVIDSQSAGIADTFRNAFYMWGGGHPNYSGNEIYKIDLTTNPVTLRRAKNPTVKDGSGNVAIPMAGGASSNGDPNFNFASSCVNAYPDIVPSGTSSFAISSISGSGGVVTVNLATSANFAVNAGNTKSIQWKQGATGQNGWVTIAGTGSSNLDGTWRVATVPNSTQLTYSKTTTDSASTGTASYTWSSCVADPITGLGCAPSSVHSTQSLAYLQNSGDHSKDVLFKYSGAVGCGPGDSTLNDAWTASLNGGITDSTAWVANHMKTGYTGIASTSGAFPDECEPDPTQGTAGYVYCADHSDSKLYGYDLANNAWHTITTPFAVGSQSSATIYQTGTGTNQFISLSGCTQSQVTSVSGNGTTVTYTLNGAPNVGFPYAANTGRWYFFNTGGYDLTNQTTFGIVASATPQVTISNATNVGTTSQGFGLWCPAVSSGSSTLSDGVFESSVSGSTAGLKNDWTAATLDPGNFDLGGVGYNTCAEALSGGQYISSTVGPLNGAASGTTGSFSTGGGISPGVTTFTGATFSGTDSLGHAFTFNTNDIVIWPNQGSNIYIARPSGSSLVCQRLTYTGNGHGNACGSTVQNNDAPCRTNSRSDASGNSTWGTWHRFSYFAQPNSPHGGFLLINASNQPARWLNP